MLNILLLRDRSEYGWDIWCGLLDGEGGNNDKCVYG
jgi:hypothetical protein